MRHVIIDVKMKAGLMHIELFSQMPHGQRKPAEKDRSGNRWDVHR